MKNRLFYSFAALILIGFIFYYKIYFYQLPWICSGHDCEKLLNADDEIVIRFLRDYYLIPPSNKIYNLDDPENKNPSMGQAQIVDQILNRKENGFFIECGALDGETRSNTLFFERERGWKGILIEADPLNFNKIIKKNRHAYKSQTCLAPSKHPTIVKFQQGENVGHIVGEMFNGDSNLVFGGIVEVHCFPLLSYLKALNTTTVDYFSLDVEGAEYGVLKEIAWDQVNIKVLSVEFLHDKADASEIENFMIKKGYTMHSKVFHDKNWAHDFIFVKKTL